MHVTQNESSFERIKNGTKTIEFLDTTSQVWVRDRVYAKIIDKMKKDRIIEIK